METQRVTFFNFTAECTTSAVGVAAVTRRCTLNTHQHSGSVGGEQHLTSFRSHKDTGAHVSSLAYWLVCQKCHFVCWCLLFLFYKLKNVYIFLNLHLLFKKYLQMNKLLLFIFLTKLYQMSDRRPALWPTPPSATSATANHFSM